MNTFDAVANMSLFLVEKNDSVLSKWVGKMPAKDQRALFGLFLGKGDITIDGGLEMLIHTRSCAYGNDYEETFYRKWSDIYK